MAISVQFGTVSKKLNSTKRFSGGTSYSCNLKETCSHTSPDIQLQIDTNPTAWNVAYIPAFNRYYWIESWEYEESVWTAHMIVDSLATYKPQIGDSELFIKRAENSDHEDIVDDEIAINGYEQSSTVIQNPFTPFSGTFIVGIVQYPGVYGGVCYFPMSFEDLKKLTSAINSTEDFDGLDGQTAVEEAINALCKCIRWLFNPAKFLVSVMYFPFTITSSGDTSYPIRLGFSSLTENPISIKPLALGDLTKTVSFDIAIPVNPYTIDYGNFLDKSPYRHLKLFLPGFGEIPLDSNLFYGSNKVSVSCRVDILTGTATALISNSIGETATVANGRLGVPVQLSSETKNPIPAVAGLVLYTKNIAKMITGMSKAAVADVEIRYKNTSGKQLLASMKERNAGNKMTRESIGGIAAGVATFTAGAVSNEVSVLGQSNGSVCEFTILPRVICEFAIPVAEVPASQIGKPFMDYATPSELGGFMVAESPNIELPATASELAEVLHYVSTGFYYE